MHQYLFFIKQANKICILLSSHFLALKRIFGAVSDRKSYILRSLIQIIVSLRNQDGYGNENFTSKYTFGLFSVFHDYCILFTLYNMGEVSLNCTGTNGFEKKRERIEDSLEFVHFVVKTLNLVISRSSFDEYGREMFKNAYRTCSTIILVLLTNNITAFWRCRCRSRRRFLNSLITPPGRA